MHCGQNTEFLSVKAGGTYISLGLSKVKFHLQDRIDFLSLTGLRIENRIACSECISIVMRGGRLLTGVWYRERMRYKA